METSSLAAVIERGFAAGVADRVSAGPITYTDRVWLMAKARRLGIDPIRANLLIGQQPRRPSARRNQLPMAAAVGIVVGLQAAVVSVVTWACLA